MFLTQNRPPLARLGGKFVTVTLCGRGEASDGAGSWVCRVGTQARLGAGALRSRGALDLVQEIGHGDHAWQAAEFARGLGDRPGFVSGLQ